MGEIISKALSFYYGASSPVTIFNLDRLIDRKKHHPGKLTENPLATTRIEIQSTLNKIRVDVSPSNVEVLTIHFDICPRTIKKYCLDIIVKQVARRPCQGSETIIVVKCVSFTLSNQQALK